MPGAAQDNILIYGNSIIDGPTVGFFEDLVVESGRPMPNVVPWILGNQSTTNYVNQMRASTPPRGRPRFVARSYRPIRTRSPSLMTTGLASAVSMPTYCSSRSRPMRPEPAAVVDGRVKAPVAS